VVPNFSHVIVIIFENTEYSSVVGSSSWPNFNHLAQQYTLMTNDYAVSHPSLPNYLALTSGSTQGITSDCTTCWINATNIADQVESSGRTWKGYMENMPSPCYLGDSGTYAQRHNPFVYYNDIRTNTTRCNKDDVPLTQFDTDLSNNQLPALAWITPNLCNDGHDCAASTADTFLGNEVNKILSSPAFDSNSLLVITFDEGTTTASCCGLPSSAGGKIATLLIGNLVKPGYQDATPYSHYSLVKTIEQGWGLSELNHAADLLTNVILAPWK
jgi:acid phosphatase